MLIPSVDCYCKITIKLAMVILKYTQSECRGKVRDSRSESLQIFISPLATNEYFSRGNIYYDHQFSPQQSITTRQMTRQISKSKSVEIKFRLMRCISAFIWWSFRGDSGSFPETYFSMSTATGPTTFGLDDSVCGKYKKNTQKHGFTLKSLNIMGDKLYFNGCEDHP